MSALAVVPPGADGVAELKLEGDPPTLDLGSGAAFERAVASLRAHPALRAVLLTGAPRHFCAGASREALEGRGDRQITRTVFDPPRALLDLGVPTVAAMEGHAIGGGWVLGLWCDLAVHAEESLYGANFVQYDLTPGMGATTVLFEALGAPMARRALLGGRLFRGRELRDARTPLAPFVVPRARVLATARGLASELAEAPSWAARRLHQELAGRRRAGLEAVVPAETRMHDEAFRRAELATRLDITYPTGGSHDP